MRFIHKYHSRIAAFLCAIMILHPLLSMAQVEDGPKAYYSGNSGVSLMFNVYQNTDCVIEILDILDKYDVKASFFLGGMWAVQNEDTVLRIMGSGHDVGNHGYSHKLPTRVGGNITHEEIDRTDSILLGITDEKPSLYAPPSGDFDESTVKLAHDLGYKTILWSADTIDWRDQDENLVLSRAVNKISSGGFLLMHPTKVTVKALPMIIESYIQMGYEIKPVSENLL